MKKESPAVASGAEFRQGTASRSQRAELTAIDSPAPSSVPARSAHRPTARARRQPTAARGSVGYERLPERRQLTFALAGRHPDMFVAEPPKLQQGPGHRLRSGLLDVLDKRDLGRADNGNDEIPLDFKPDVELAIKGLFSRPVFLEPPIGFDQPRIAFW